MISVIIYSTDQKYLNKTIDSLIDSTAKTLITEIIVCDDTNSGYSRDGVTVLYTNRIGKAKAWNKAVDSASGTIVAFLRDKTKFTDDWLYPIVDAIKHNKNGFFSPVVHTLDMSLWSIEPTRWRRFGWRWDMNIHGRIFSGKPDSPSLSDQCIVCTKSRFLEIGGFDDGMGLGGGADIEISLRNWLFGGGCYVCDKSVIGVALEVDASPETTNNLARIVELWLPGYSSHFYNSRKIKPTDVDVGRLDNILRLKEKQRHPIEYFLESQQPELVGIYDLRGIAGTKSVAVVGPGPSLDHINSALINRHDIIIGVDYVGHMFDCDYVVTASMNTAIDLQSKYPESKLVLPVALENRIAGQWVATGDVIPGAYQFEFASQNVPPVAADPPFCDFDNSVVVAVQLALFMGPAQITIFGADNKLVGGNSHTSKIGQYDGGRLWSDGEALRRRFAAWEFVLDQLGRLSLASGIPMLRVTHA